MDSNPTVPTHLTEMFAKLSEHLDIDKQFQLASLLNEYQDFFAKDEFDLGTVTGIEHVIDTGDAKPINSVCNVPL